MSREDEYDYLFKGRRNTAASPGQLPGEVSGRNILRKSRKRSPRLSRARGTCRRLGRPLPWVRNSRPSYRQSPFSNFGVDIDLPLLRLFKSGQGCRSQMAKTLYQLYTDRLRKEAISYSCFLTARTYFIFFAVTKTPVYIDLGYDGIWWHVQIQCAKPTRVVKLEIPARNVRNAPSRKVETKWSHKLLYRTPICYRWQRPGQVMAHVWPLILRAASRAAPALLGFLGLFPPRCKRESDWTSCRTHAPPGCAWGPISPLIRFLFIVNLAVSLCMSACTAAISLFLPCHILVGSVPCPKWTTSLKGHTIV